MLGLQYFDLLWVCFSIVIDSYGLQPVHNCLPYIGMQIINFEVLNEINKNIDGG